MQSNFIKSAMALLAGTSITSCAVKDTSSASKPSINKTESVSAYSKKTGTKDKHGMPSYTDGSRTRYVRATAYSHMEHEVGAPGRMTASGTILKYGKLRSVAADWSRLPLGTKFKIKGQSATYVVDDYGSALIGTNTIDMFYPSHSVLNNCI